MPSLAEVQAEFAAALRDPAGAPPTGAVDPRGRPDRRRFAIYRNNVIVGLSGALAAGFPAVKRIVGDDFFMAMARAYVLAEPPGSPVLMEYGAGFADFIAGFEPAARLPYLQDVARIERAWRESYHAAEATPFDPATLAGLGEDRLPHLTMYLHPSLRLLRSPFPALTAWRMNAGHEPVGPIDFAAGGEDTLIVRPAADVEVRLLPPGGLAFISALRRGATLAHAAAEGVTDAAGFDLAGNLTGLIAAGAIVAISNGAKQ